MISFGLISSIFDFLTFGFLLLLVKANAATFQTTWFVESLITQLSIVLIVRTHKSFRQSRPSALLAVAIPYLPDAERFGFAPLPSPVMTGLVAISLLYVVISEATKKWFFGHERRLTRGRT